MSWRRLNNDLNVDKKKVPQKRGKEVKPQRGGVIDDMRFSRRQAGEHEAQGRDLDGRRKEHLSD